MTARYDRARPLYLVGLADDAGTRLYVSSRSGEIVLDTNHTERFWNWLGSIPHWIYPTVLRKDGPLWRLVVLWISGICLIVGMTGIWIGILRVRLRRRYAGGQITPYRGWMAWHHITGLIAGIFVLTWMFSGWLSLNPGEYFANRNTPRDVLQRYAGHDAPTIAGKLPAPQRASVEARFVWLDGGPMMILASRDGVLTPTDVTSGDVALLPLDRLWTAATRLLPQASLARRTFSNDTTPTGARTIRTANCPCCVRYSTTKRKPGFTSARSPAILSVARTAAGAAIAGCSMRSTVSICSYS